MRLCNSFLVVACFTIFLLAFAGCEKNNSFISNTKLEQKLEGTWHMVPLYLNDPSTIDWVFEAGGNLTILNSADTNYLEHGSWTPSAHLIGSKLVINSIKDTTYNGKWHIVNLKNDRMQLNINYKGCPEGQTHCGTLQREFYR
jgi:hypothetical protein